jgi:hypothetical protein
MFPFSYFQKQSTQKIISDNDIKGKTIQQIEELKQLQENKFDLTNIGLHNAYEENDKDKMIYLKQQFGLRLPGYGNYHIDVAIETGNTDMSKYLVNDFNCQPSLYAKQMGRINGHKELVDWIDKFTEQRNNVGIDIVHRHYSKEKRTWVWNGVIPEEYRILNSRL